MEVAYAIIPIVYSCWICKIWESSFARPNLQVTAQNRKDIFLSTYVLSLSELCSESSSAVTINFIYWPSHFGSKRDN